MTAVYFFAGILGVLLVAVLVAPLLDRAPAGSPASDPEARLDEALEALRDLEFEYETGKIDEEDYRVLRSEYAAAALAARDAGAEVRPHRADAARAGAAAACAVCGARIAADARYCSRCGTAVVPEGPDREGTP